MPITERFFDPLPAAENLPAAYCLAGLELLSYTGSESFLQMWAESMGFTFWQKVTTPERFCPNLMAAGGNRKLVIAIPGTESLAQMMQNIIYSAQRSNAEFGAGRMHSFFLWCAESIVSFISHNAFGLNQVDELVFVGHSLGGAVAQLLADWVSLNTNKQVKLCCTFNSPRVGDPEYARRFRTYPLHNYYNSHDMVCEMPPSISPSSTAWQTEGIFVDAYEHRDELTRIESQLNIDESWLSITVAKFAEAAKQGLTRLGIVQDAARVSRLLGYTATRTAFASNVLPLPAWYVEHTMHATMTNLRAMFDFQQLPQKNVLRTIQDAIPISYPGGPTWVDLSPADRRGVVSPLLFANGQTPQGFDLSALNESPPGGGVEVVESAFNWDGPTPTEGLPPSSSVEREFLDTILQQVLIDSGRIPAPPTPLRWHMPDTANWHFKGRDRRLLSKLWDVMGAIEARDTIASQAEKTAAISTREIIADLDDPDIADAWLILKECVSRALWSIRE